MWIIPTNSPIYPCAQDMEGLTSDSQELSEMCAQSLMWRSKPSQSSTWLKRLKRVSWIQPLSSQTLKSSLGNSIVGKWTCSLEASLVSHLARPDEEPEMKTRDTYGPSSSKESENWADLPLFSLRMLKGSSQVSSKGIVGKIEKERRFCFMSSESWRDWVTSQRRVHSRRLRSALHTKEKESSFLVSEMTSSKAVMILSRQDSNDGLKQYSQEAKAQPAMYGSRRELHWSTPTTRDWKDAGNTKRLKPMKNGTERLGLVPQQVLEIENYTGKLNARWVDALMGLPIGWTSPSCVNPLIVELMSSECLGMELCQTQQAEHSERCLKDY